MNDDRLEIFEKLLEEVRADVKILLENMHKDQGAKAVKTSIVAAIVSVIALFCNITINYIRFK